MVPVIEALETHDGVTTTTWAPSAVRPGDYPVDLPFLADHPATMLSVRGSTTLEWEGAPPRMAEVLARTESIVAGWSAKKGRSAG